MSRSDLFAFLFTACLAACASRAEQRLQTFGAPLSAAEPVPVASVLAEPERFHGQRLVLEGPVREVCKNKGCWLLMAEDGRELRVRFADYAFFVPKDCEGRLARCEGVFAIADVPADEARHYLEDAGRFEEAQRIHEPVRSYTFVATGVRLSP